MTVVKPTPTRVVRMTRVVRTRTMDEMKMLTVKCFRRKTGRNYRHLRNERHHRRLYCRRRRRVPHHRRHGPRQWVSFESSGLK